MRWQDWVFGPAVYNWTQWLMGADRAWRILVSDYVRPRPTDRLLDIGCGTGRILRYLPAVEYSGIDADCRVVQWAQKNYGHRGRFRCAAIDEPLPENWGPFEVVLANGVLHHVDDTTAGRL